LRQTGGIERAHLSEAVHSLVHKFAERIAKQWAQHAAPQANPDHQEELLSVRHA